VGINITRYLSIVEKTILKWNLQIDCEDMNCTELAEDKSTISGFCTTVVIFKVLVAMSMKMNVFWDVAQCNPVETDRRFRGAYCLHHQGDNGGSKHLRNIGQFVPNYTVQLPRRQSSSVLSLIILNLRVP
jgi:hypothetical protein